MPRFAYLTSALALASLVVVSAHSTAASVPLGYSEDFNDTPIGAVPPNFVSGGSSPAPTVQEQSPGDNGYQFTISKQQTKYSALQFSNLTGNPFAVSVDFTLDSFTAGAATMNFGLVLFDADGDLTNGNNYRLSYTVIGTGSPGIFSLSEQTGTGTVTTSSGGTITPVEGTTYHMSISGWYESTTLFLSASLTDGNSTVTWQGNDTSPVAGSYIGIRAASSSTANAEVVTADNFVTAVPEPSAALLLALTGSVWTLRRRRRSSV